MARQSRRRRRVGVQLHQRYNYNEHLHLHTFTHSSLEQFADDLDHDGFIVNDCTHVAYELNAASKRDSVPERDTIHNAVGLQ